jgi:hypothetical protein
LHHYFSHQIPIADSPGESFQNMLQGSMPKIPAGISIQIMLYIFHCCTKCRECNAVIPGLEQYWITTETWQNAKQNIEVRKCYFSPHVYLSICRKMVSLASMEDDQSLT